MIYSVVGFLNSTLGSMLAGAILSGPIVQYIARLLSADRFFWVAA